MTQFLDQIIGNNQTLYFRRSFINLSYSCIPIVPLSRHIGHVSKV